MDNNLLNQITDILVEGEPELVVELTRKAIDSGLEPIEIIDSGLIPGMDIVGEKFSSGEFFLPNLIVAAEGMKGAMELLEPLLREKQQASRSPGKVVIGTVQGDIHEIGKSLVATMLAANGFTVYDLGVDVPVEEFVAKIKETGADLLGLSALLTTTMEVQREVIEELQRAGLKDRVKVMVGGAPVTRSWAEEIGADGYSEDAIGAVNVALELAKKPA